MYYRLIRCRSPDLIVVYEWVHTVIAVPCLSACCDNFFRVHQLLQSAPSPDAVDYSSRHQSKQCSHNSDEEQVYDLLLLLLLSLFVYTNKF